MLSILLSRQFKAYCNDDPKEVQQKALPFAVLDELAKRQVTDLDKAIVQLTISAASFACPSCKYVNVPRREIKRTKLLCLQNIRFFKDRHLLLASLDNLEFANSVAVTFEMQNKTPKTQYGHPRLDRQCRFVSSSAMGTPRRSDLDIPWHYRGCFSLHGLAP